MKITVAIPTIAGREKYLAACLKTCVTQDNEDFEILVSDNSKDHGASDLVSQLGDKRIRYVYPPEYLPMSRHWDFVLSQVSGDMLTIIGDDDGLMPGCINRVLELTKEFPSKIIHHSFCNYVWPDYPNSNIGNTVVFFHDIGSTVTIVSANDILRGFCDGRLRYLDGPMVYHNFVPTRLLRQLEREGVVFRRSSPDIYSAVALAANVESFVSTQECLTISGQGARSTGASVRMGGPDGEKFCAEVQHPLYKPRFNSKTVQLHLLDCIFEVAEEFAKPSMVDGIVYEKHLASALIEIPGLSGWQTKVNEVLEVMRIARHTGVTARLLSELCKFTLRYMKKRYNRNGGRNILRRSGQLKMNQSVTDVYEASVEVDKIIHCAATSR